MRAKNFNETTFVITHKQDTLFGKHLYGIIGECMVWWFTFGVTHMTSIRYPWFAPMAKKNA